LGAKRAQRRAERKVDKMAPKRELWERSSADQWDRTWVAQLVNQTVVLSVENSAADLVDQSVVDSAARKVY
jgi:hypothetical protein